MKKMVFLSELEEDEIIGDLTVDGTEYILPVCQKLRKLSSLLPHEQDSLLLLDSEAELFFYYYVIILSFCINKQLWLMWSVISIPMTSLISASCTEAVVNTMCCIKFVQF